MLKNVRKFLKTKIFYISINFNIPTIKTVDYFPKNTQKIFPSKD